MDADTEELGRDYVFPDLDEEDGDLGFEAEPEEKLGNRFERMSLAEVSRLATKATQGDDDGLTDETLPGPFGALDNEEFLAAMAEATKPVDLIDWDETDVSPSIMLARRHAEVREAGLDGDLAQAVLDGDMTLAEGIARAEANQEAILLLQAQPPGLTDSLDPDELDGLITAAKQGYAEEEVRRLAKRKGLSHG
jgi:hypothetical protein